jgi:hypothetical protein
VTNYFPGVRREISEAKAFVAFRLRQGEAMTRQTILMVVLAFALFLPVLAQNEDPAKNQERIRQGTVLSQDEKQEKEQKGAKNEALIKRLAELGIAVNNQPVLQAEIFTIAPEASRIVVKLQDGKTMVLALTEKVSVKNGKKNFKIKDLKRLDKVILILESKTMAVSEIHLDKKS